MEWEILKLIGCGSYGSVHLVRNCKTMELAALKTSKCFEDGHLVIGALRELFFYSSFSPSPGVCGSLGHWKVGDTLNVLLPLYPCTLESVYIQFQNSLPFNDFIRLLRDSVKGLKAMHHQAYLHRDIKPENILVSNDGACLTDFNLMRWAAFDSQQLSTEECASQSPVSEPTVSCAPSFCFRRSADSRVSHTKTFSSLKDNASSLVCTLWTRAPELVHGLLKKKKRLSYGSEVDIFSLGSTFFALAAGDFIIGKKCSLEKVKFSKAKTPSSVDTEDENIQNTKEYRYLGGFLKTFGVSKEINEFYGSEFTSHRQWDTAPSAIYEFIKQQLLWSTEQLVSVSILLAKMLHPMPSHRATLSHIEKWLEKYSTISTPFSQTFQLFLLRKQGKLLEKIPRVCSKIMQVHPLFPEMQDFDAQQFWSLCSASFIPPYIACEAIRIKQTLPLSLQYSKALLYLFDCMHEFQQAENYKLMAGVDVENVFALASVIKPSKETIDMALSLYSTPFLLCCLAAELFVTGKLCNLEELKNSKTMHLSTVKPFFEAYGNTWKSQVPLRQTWNRLT